MRIADLLSTRLQSVRIELVGTRTSTFTRLGTLLAFLPFLFVGYLLMLASLLRLLAASIGWGTTLFAIGLIHVALSIWGIVRTKDLDAATQTYDVVDPALVASDPMPQPTARASSVESAG